MASRSGKLPASVVPLALLLVAVAVWLLIFEGGNDTEPGREDAGVLLPFSAERVTRLEVVQGGASVLLERAGEAWRLSGHNRVGPWQDRVEPYIAARLIALLCESRVVTVLADTTDRRPGYGLDPAEALGVMVMDEDDHTMTLAVGVSNPVSGRFYASGAERRTVFTLPEELGRQLQTLPNAVRLRRLWPAFDRREVESVAIRRVGALEEELFIRLDDTSWWVRLPQQSPRRLGRVAPAYDRHYGDRRLQRDGATYWRADERALFHLLYMLGETRITEFGPLPASSAELRRAGLRPPTVAVRVTPGAGTPHLAAAFGSAHDDAMVSANRDGRDHILYVTGEAMAALSAPLAEFLETDVLALAWTAVDSFSLWQDGARRLRAVRSSDGWRSVLPPAATGVDTITAHNVCADLIHHLQRLSIVSVLPPVTAGNPLAGRERTELTLWLSGVPGRHSIVVNFGKLAGTGEPAAYFPADGKLLLIPPDMLINFRSIFTALRLGNRS